MRRENGRGTAVYLSGNRSKPWVARLTLGYDYNGNPVRYDFGGFKTKLDALVCLENFFNNPHPLYIRDDVFNKITTYSRYNYDLIPVDDINNIKRKNRISKKYCTFSELYKEFSEMKFPSIEEIDLEKKKNVKPIGKFSLSYLSSIKTAYNFSIDLHDRIYKDLRTSDFQKVINKKANIGRSYSSVASILKFFRLLDKFAIQEDIIEKGYSQFAEINIENVKIKNKSIYVKEEIDYLWCIDNFRGKDMFVRDILLIALYTGCRISELLFLYTKNIYLDKNYFVGGIKTSAGKNREIPIHRKIKHIFEKYYDTSNEFLFMFNGETLNYQNYKTKHKIFIRKHKDFINHTTHECRHTFRTEMERLNIKHVIINSIIGHSNKDIGLDVYTHSNIECMYASTDFTYIHPFFIIYVIYTLSTQKA